MKKLLLAILSTGMLTATANAATVYKSDAAKLDIGGRLQAHVGSVSLDSGDEQKVKMYSKARLRINAESKIVDGYKGIAFTEWEMGSQTSQNGKWNTRFAYVGIKSDNYGTLTLGQDYSAMFNVVGLGYLFTEWAKGGTTYWDFGGRQEGQIMYKYSNGGFYAGANYQTASLNKVKDGVSASMGYKFNHNNDNAPLINAVVGFDYYNVENTTDDRKSIAGGVSYGVHGDGLYLATLYMNTQMDESEDIHGYEIAGSYTWDCGVKLMLNYQNKTQDGATLVSSTNGELQYAFNSNFKAITEWEIGIGDIDKVDSLGRKIGSTKERQDDKFMVGLQYNF